MSNPHFNVINSNSLETLAKICAQLMERYPLADPLLNEEIVVMNMGMRSFLTQEIAKQNQIAAQCNFQQIWQLIWNIHNKVNGSDDKLNRFDRAYICCNVPFEISFVEKICRQFDFKTFVLDSSHIYPCCRKGRRCRKCFFKQEVISVFYKIISGQIDPVVEYGQVDTDV